MTNNTDTTATTDNTGAKEKTLYEVLGLAPNAKSSVVDFTYNALLEDLNGDPEANKDAISELSAAYQILKEPNSRAWYDNELAKKAAQAETKAEPKAADTAPAADDAEHDDEEPVVAAKPKSKFKEFLKTVSMGSLVIWGAVEAYDYVSNREAPDMILNTVPNTPVDQTNAQAQNTTNALAGGKSAQSQNNQAQNNQAQNNLSQQFAAISGDRRLIICTPTLSVEQQRNNVLLNTEVLPALAAQDALIDTEKKDPNSAIYAALKEGHLRITYQSHDAENLTPVYHTFNTASLLKCPDKYIQYPARNTTLAGYETSYKATDALAQDKRTSDLRRIKAPGETSRFAP